MFDDPSLVQSAMESKAWPFEEARKLLTRMERRASDGGGIIFETGYGPSGLPHIGTFGEVARTTMVRTAFRLLTGDEIPTRLICFSDDMDAFRKVPDNVPNQEKMATYIGKPLTEVPDPFSDEYESFAHHNNARLRVFLDRFDFDYEFASSTDYYRGGHFDEALMRMLEVYDQVMEIILPTLGEERRQTYSPFLPVCPRTGVVLQVPMVARDEKRGTISYVDPQTNETVEVQVTGGHVKCQWKADWAMRWFALGVDYEMAGKDLIDSVMLSSRICKALGAPPPDGFNYELFLDENAQKISKSKGNGLTIDEWLRYAAPESLQLFMYQSPRKAKRLYFDVIPKHVDEYLTFLSKYPDQEVKEQLGNPVWHIHGGSPPDTVTPVSFALLLNLVSASNAHEPGVLWGFIRNYAPEASPESHPTLAHMVDFAIQYFHDFVKPTKTFRAPTDVERTALRALADMLGGLDRAADAETIQNAVYEIGKTHDFENLRDWFRAIYEVLLGQSQGPRFGSFIALFGIDETIALIDKGLAGELL
jgi:lysyl-tRNA synthetase class 1